MIVEKNYSRKLFVEKIFFFLCFGKNILEWLYQKKFFEKFSEIFFDNFALKKNFFSKKNCKFDLLEIYFLK